MGIFGSAYTKMGPGVPKGEPRKKGALRFFEVIRRDFGNLVKLSLLFFACCLPAVALFIAAVLVPGATLVFFILAAVAALPAGGAATAAHYCVTKMLRDDPGFLGYDFWRKLIENFRATAAFGVVCALLMMIQAYGLMSFLANGFAATPIWLIVLWLLSVVLVGVLCPYFYTQAAYMTLRAGDNLRNSLLLAFANFPCSLAGALAGDALLGALLVFWPSSAFMVPIMPFLGCSLSILLTQMWVWPVLDGQFGIEDKLRKMEEEECPAGKAG